MPLRLYIQRLAFRARFFLASHALPELQVAANASHRSLSRSRFSPTDQVGFRRYDLLELGILSSILQHLINVAHRRQYALQFDCRETNIRGKFRLKADGSQINFLSRHHIHPIPQPLFPYPCYVSSLSTSGRF